MGWPFSASSEKDASIQEGNTSNTIPKRSSERKSSFQFDAPTTPSKAPPPSPKPLTTPQPSSDTHAKPLLLEDTEPRFNNGPDRPEIPIKEAVNKISLESFKFDNLVKIPCFREAGLTGLSALGVLGTIIFIAQKSPAKAANWGVGGFLLGSTVSWEQCRSKRRRELAFAATARETVAAKERPMLTKAEEKTTEDQLKNREEVKSWWKRT
jgi:cytochrome c oxidase assembly protein subunit 20